MTLTADQLENLIENASNADYTTDGNMAACDAARRDLAAMRQPITAEALTAAGWEHDECWFDLPGSIVSVQQRDATTFDVYVIGYGASVPTKGVTTMYALGQLVELLGGK